jgi:hypothetical protein
VENEPKLDPELREDAVSLDQESRVSGFAMVLANGSFL